MLGTYIFIFRKERYVEHNTGNYSTQWRMEQSIYSLTFLFSLCKSCFRRLYGYGECRMNMNLNLFKRSLIFTPYSPLYGSLRPREQISALPLAKRVASVIIVEQAQILRHVPQSSRRHLAAEDAAEEE